MRLIDADALIAWIDMGHLRNPLESCFSERDVVDMLESRPTVDAVEVVRCKDCRFYETGVEYYTGEDSVGTKDLCRLYRRQELEDSFCAHGERRADHAS